jgi:hypothetical protein
VDALAIGEAANFIGEIAAAADNDVICSSGDFG